MQRWTDTHSPPRSSALFLLNAEPDMAAARLIRPVSRVIAEARAGMGLHTSAASLGRVGSLQAPGDSATRQVTLIPGHGCVSFRYK
jgi:hypothetical protein